MCCILFVSIIVFAFKIPSVNASGTIYIRADGSIDPPTAPVQRRGDIYTLTGDTSSDADGIVIQRDNIVLDGAGFTIQGSGNGISLISVSNVTIQNTNIKDFYAGIWLDSSSSNNIVTGNNITANTYYGISLHDSCNYNSISGNNITNNEYGIWLYSSSNSSISGNNITDGYFGIWLNSSSNYNNMSGNKIAKNFDKCITLDSSSNYNIVSGNDLTANSYCGIYLNSSSNNILIENDIAYNVIGVMLISSFNDSISGNSFDKNGLFVAEDSSGNLVSDNLVNGKPLVYLEGVSDVVVSDAGEVVLVQCNRIRVEDLNLSSATIGVELWQTNNTEVARNNVTANSQLGIYLYSSFNNSMSRNNIANNAFGISLTSSSNNNISGNVITANDPCGVSLDQSSNNTIEQNSLAGNERDIVISESDGNTIRDNDLVNVMTSGGLSKAASPYKMINCPESGVYESSTSGGLLADSVAGIDGLTLLDSTDTKIIGNSFSNAGVDISGSDFVHFIASVENNTVNGKPLRYYRGQENFTVSENVGQLIMVDCGNVTIRDISVSHTDCGVQICYSSDVIFRNSTITDCQYGVRILSTNSTVICQNTIANNSVGLSIEGNDFLESVVYHNIFVNNLLQVSCPTVANYGWDNGYPSGGNYWSDYTGTDLYSGPYQNETGQDGKGDTPYVIDSNNIDGYPLMSPSRRLLGDINGDLTVDIFDAIILAGAFNSVPNSSNWNPNADINGDGVVDIFDAIILAGNFSSTW
jgi:parallel beta-helix repeat protein